MDVIDPIIGELASNTEMPIEIETILLKQKQVLLEKIQELLKNQLKEHLNQIEK